MILTSTICPVGSLAVAESDWLALVGGARDLEEWLECPGGCRSTPTVTGSRMERAVSSSFLKLQENNSNFSIELLTVGTLASLNLNTITNVP